MSKIWEKDKKKMVIWSGFEKRRLSCGQPNHHWGSTAQGGGTFAGPPSEYTGDRAQGSHRSVHPSRHRLSLQAQRDDRRERGEGVHVQGRRSGGGASVLMAATIVCPECSGCGWRPYSVETLEDKVEWA